jgi:hypothetical protein
MIIPVTSEEIGEQKRIIKRGERAIEILGELLTIPIQPDPPPGLMMVKTPPIHEFFHVIRRGEHALKLLEQLLGV